MKAKAVPWVISQSDVDKVQESQSLESVLYTLGMDVSKGFTTDNRHLTEVEEGDEVENQEGFMHRSAFTGELCLGPRYVGVARQDKSWKRFTEAFVETHAI